jgi:hypothetical protein
MNTVFDIPDRRQHLREIANILSILECQLIYEGNLERRNTWGWSDSGEWRRGEPR